MQHPRRVKGRLVRAPGRGVASRLISVVQPFLDPSPRARGDVSCLNPNTFAAGCIPAVRRTAFWPVDWAWPTRVHLRFCAAALLAAVSRRSSQGSSPRVRGRLSSAMNNMTHSGFIPQRSPHFPHRHSWAAVAFQPADPHPRDPAVASSCPGFMTTGSGAAGWRTHMSQ